MFQKIANFFSGKSTFFILGFFITGNVLHWLHRLDATYITFMATLLGFVVGHSVKEDYFHKDS